MAKPKRDVAWRQMKRPTWKDKRDCKMNEYVKIREEEPNMKRT